MHLIRSTGVNLVGKKAVVVGRSDLVGKPLAQMLLREDATVSICHSKTSTEDLAAIVQESDVLVSATGRAGLINGHWIKQGAIVIDIGIAQIEDTGSDSGYKIVGDVDFANAIHRAGFITPVPGGVGPLTVAMLLENVYHATMLHK